NIRRRGGPASLVIAHYPPDRTLEGRSLADVAAARAVPPEEAALDLIAVRDVSIVSFNMSMDDIDALMTRPWTMTSSDGSIAFPGEGRPHPRGNGAFTRKLTTFVRERQLLRLPEALQTMTRLPANVFGLTQHGRLEPGAIADVVVFGLDRLEDRATYMDPHQLASGMSYVFVDGTAAIEDGRFTDALAGRVLPRQPAHVAHSGRTLNGPAAAGASGGADGPAASGNGGPAPFGDRPQIDRLAVHLHGFFRLPVAHVEIVRHDARARTQLLHQDRPQLQVQPRQQVQRDDGRL